MDTSGFTGNSDFQKLFNNPLQPGHNPPAPFPHPNASHPFHNLPSTSFPQTEAYGPLTSPLPGSNSFVSHGSKMQQYPFYSQDEALDPPPQVYPQAQPAPPVPLSSSFHTKSSSRPSSPALDSARLMALLSYQATSGLDIPTSHEPPSSSAQTLNSNSEVSFAPAALAPALPSAPPVSLASVSAYGRPNNKLPRGRHLQGQHVVYDVDARLPGDVPPQLEVTPITMYSSLQEFNNGRQITVNRSYICYGLRPNRHIRILNINTAARSLLRGHSEVCFS